MKKSHQWEENGVIASCPYCHKDADYCSYGEGDTLNCQWCGRPFQLGKPE